MVAFPSLPSGAGASSPSSPLSRTSAECQAFSDENDAFTDWSNFSPCSESCGKYGLKTSVRTCLNLDLCQRAGFKGTDEVITVPCYGGACPEPGGWSNWGFWTACSASCGTGRRTRMRRCDDPYPYNGADCLGPSVSESSCSGELCGKPPKEEEEEIEEGEEEEEAESDEEEELEDTKVPSGESGDEEIVENLELEENVGDALGEGSLQGLRRKKRSQRSRFPINMWTPNVSSIQARVNRFSLRKPTLGSLRFKNFSGLNYSAFYQSPKQLFEINTSYNLVSKPLKKDKISLHVKIKTFPNSRNRMHITHLPGSSRLLPSKFFTQSKLLGNVHSPVPESNSVPKKRLQFSEKVSASSEWTTVSMSSWGKRKRRSSLGPAWMRNNAGRMTQTRRFRSGRKDRKRFTPSATVRGKRSVVITKLKRKPDEISEDDPYDVPLNAELEYLYTTWTEWTLCSQTCGGGTRTRTRKCTNENIVCRGEISPVQFCNLDSCPFPGGWSAWESWNPCSVTCGQGVSQRYRACDHPLPKYGGACPGPRNESRPCTAPSSCSGNIFSWSDWTAWTTCSKTCGGGQRSRSRSLFMSAVNTREETSVCSQQPCPVHGMWAAWGGWAECSKACGLGRAFRDRTCTDPSPVYGGEPCRGQGSESMICYSGPCRDADDYGLLFEGAGYLVYPRRKHPTSFVMIFLRIKPLMIVGTVFHYYHLCKDDLHDCHVSIMASLTNRRVQLQAKVEKNGEMLSFKHPALLTKRKWQDIFVLVTEHWAELRVNDGEREAVRFSDNPTEEQNSSLNLVGELSVGANRQMSDGRSTVRLCKIILLLLIVYVDIGISLTPVACVEITRV
ncbi:hemicentin-1 [Elysia marginata]|uniref:Hemicentin-1 n=1 Tax=Elysia marginata TaxID=1093978 RepID=A0AAV4H1W2_9GAST|nr:hemicentin-1 [Elysia marginata]